MKNFVESDYSSDESFVTRLNDIVYQFDNEWRSGRRPEIEKYLSQETESKFRLIVLRELVCIDLEYRLKAKETARIESYIERFPELQDDQATLELIAHENLVRSNLNPSVSGSYLLLSILSVL